MLLLSLLILPLSLPSQGMYVTNGSSCASRCAAGHPTTDADIICDDAQYTTSDVGKATKKCFACEARSTWTNQSDPTDNDIYWFLYNQKYTIDYCLWKHPGNTSALPKCLRYCGPLNGALDRTWGLDAEQYDYCEWGNGGLGTYAKDCAACLGSVRGSVVLGNFVSTLEANCASRPNASLGQSANITRRVLFASAVTPMAEETGAPGAGGDGGGLSGGAIAGVVIGVVVGVGVLVGGFLWLFIRRRRGNRQGSIGGADTGAMQQEKMEQKQGQQPVQELHEDTARFELPDGIPIEQERARKRDPQSPVELQGS